MDQWNADLYKSKYAFVFEYGNSLIDWLQPQEGEAILDLGCGTGELTAELAQLGASVTGIDASASMIESARKHFPEVNFVVADATSFSLPRQFDGIFSNATLHWIREADKVAERMAHHLKPGGRLVIEMGGKGNVESIVKGLERAMEQRGYSYAPFWYFPSPAEYATLLEKAGFRIDRLQYFDRPSKLVSQEDGIIDWLEMFAGHFFATVPENDKKAIMEQVQHEVAPQLTKDDGLYADYVRLRVGATKI
ncbi:Trans-aconitate methyltransferase [Chitinophaga terrae (ex Kim and Jung 2007)]|uniref:Trans-aconitate methyltransferase n=1 Tax=Chitinophaga terrae (ex Kim and Jung 2007) TaxID=408074 RepID=A0A1H4FVX3_9BACT|nr:class I SAM-dependent methyltransferase [Chitinophaga terrae (ex Kim and Jung 2007)]MDQ0108213.1 trans-aconitate methyltransferase [Chitinophaga terrae (ex Kim and Jung 2007)]GEP92800.1 methyltransferase type 11 [Chitinophaga terrae (ex Kim and Jung 2007)]SEB01247.1 Trans-aconitate methyltransferase [Chitinophaga terrae (ex Kim and Jung 2007)]